MSVKPHSINLLGLFRLVYSIFLKALLTAAIKYMAQTSSDMSVTVFRVIVGSLWRLVRVIGRSSSSLFLLRCPTGIRKIPVGQV